MWRGGYEYQFVGRESSFRDQEFTFIDLVRRKGLFSRTTELPFTTELGKTWNLWQAFRELHANTIDEEGRTFLSTTTDEEFSRDYSAYKGQTLIIVEGSAYVDEYHRMDTTFLPDALRLREAGDAAVQRFDRPNKFVYYRGMRVHELREGSQYTYNILNGLDLTEDRTAKYSWQVDQIIASFVKGHTDVPFIRRVINAAQGTYERKLAYNYSYNEPSKEFLAEARSAGPRAPEEVRAIVKTYEPPVEAEHLDFPQRVGCMIEAVDQGNRDRLWELIEQDRDEFLEFLQNAASNHSKMGGGDRVGLEPFTPSGNYEVTDGPKVVELKHTVPVDDDIPF